MIIKLCFFPQTISNSYDLKKLQGYKLSSKSTYTGRLVDQVNQFWPVLFMNSETVDENFVTQRNLGCSTIVALKKNSF